jgi:phosphatidylglycerophosphatase A
MEKPLSFQEHKDKEEIEQTTGVETIPKAAQTSGNWFTRAFRRNFNLHTIISTWFFVGKFPIAPGTAGSLAAYPVYYLAIKYGDNLEQISLYLYCVCFVLILLGLWSIRVYTKQIEKPDHRSIVLDEVIGQLLTIAIGIKALYVVASFVSWYSTLHKYQLVFFVAFFIFRFFDISKPLGINFINKKIHTPMGVMLDDVIAAFYGVMVIIVVARILELFI